MKVDRRGFSLASPFPTTPSPSLLFTYSITPFNIPSLQPFNPPPSSFLHSFTTTSFHLFHQPLTIPCELSPPPSLSLLSTPSIISSPLLPFCPRTPVAPSPPRANFSQPPSSWLLFILTNLPYGHPWICYKSGVSFSASPLSPPLALLSHLSISCDFLSRQFGSFSFLLPFYTLRSFILICWLPLPHCNALCTNTLMETFVYNHICLEIFVCWHLMTCQRTYHFDLQASVG